MQTPPFRTRPKLHLTLTQSTGSPGNASQPAQPSGIIPMPSNTTAYSPFRSAGLKPPTPYGGPTQFTPRSSRKFRDCRHNLCFCGRRVLNSKIFWLALLLGALALWWTGGGADQLDIVKLSASELGRELFPEVRTRDLQFFPATSPKIHYVGRWTATPNRLRRDGTFPGVYFEVAVKNTSTLFVSLHNVPEPRLRPSEPFPPSTAASSHRLNVVHVPFRPVPSREDPSPPVSLLARVDQEEYILLPNASALVAVCDHDLSKSDAHYIRIVAPMTDNNGAGIVELEGIWLSKGGKLLHAEGSFPNEEYEYGDSLGATNEQGGGTSLGEATGTRDCGIGAEESESCEPEDDRFNAQRRKKMLEVITDSPGSIAGNRRSSRTGGADGLLAGVMGWEYLLGEIFGADHVSIGVDGMCLTQSCIGGVGQPNGIGDVFFRSGPFGSEYFEHPWMFDAYVPDVIIINIGDSDATSFEMHEAEYNKTAWELFERFEDLYISLIKGIRSLAYPQHPSIVHNQRSGHPAYASGVSPAFIPIFVMRPLRGQLEHITQNVVGRLRSDGDKAVFWLDTSGWLEMDNEFSAAGDFFLDQQTIPPKWRLTEQGNQRVAIFLHSHVCRYLAGEEEKCAFLPHEEYQGKVFNPLDAEFARHLENEKERKLKKLFWDEEPEKLSEPSPVI